MKKILYSSAEVRREIIRLFKFSSSRRVAISAFVGKGADAYLPNPKGLKLVCWPKAGGTNPHMLRKLMSNGVEVLFADRLHMKVYWNENHGAILTSANLSTNALGSGNLKEAGILLTSEDIDIDRLLESINPRPASESELRKLDRRHKSYIVRNKLYSGRTSGVMSFEKWYESPFRTKWKLGWFDDFGPISLVAKERAMKEYNEDKPKDWISAHKGDFREDDWILTFYLKKSPSKVEWISVDYVVEVPKSDKNAYEKDYPCQVAQVGQNYKYPPPPFRITSKFRKEFSKAVREYGAEKVKALKTVEPPKYLIDLIYAKYRK